MAKDFIAPATPETTKVVRDAISFEEMVEGLRRAAGVDKSHYDPFTGKHWEVAPEELPVEQQQAAATASAAQVVLSLTARNPSDHEFRRIYRGNSEYEIWGSSSQELDAKEKQIREMLS